jgi:trans-2,3-dihydro-3-hydroxyanthranilate isomerase
MPSYEFHTVDVFTDTRFGGNPLAVFPNAQGMTDAQMQALATEFNLSETTFVLPPQDPRHTARVRIFNRTEELPFAGHPNVGTGYLLSRLSKDLPDVLLFEEIAGLVEIRILRSGASNAPIGASIAAPRPLTIQLELPAAQIAACLGLQVSQLDLAEHAPTAASVGLQFVLVRVSADALGQIATDTAAFARIVRAHPALGGRCSVHAYALDGSGIRARMFSPLSGTFEDAATGSANAALGAFLLHRSGDPSGRYPIVQGVEMGRPSRLTVTARREDGAILASVAGHCVDVLQGVARL